MSMKPGATIRPLASITRSASAGEPRPHRGDAVALDRDVGRARGRAAAVHHRAVRG